MEQIETYLQDLNQQQLEAVRYDGGPSLVIAGAGSGKTRVLTNKITYLIAQGYDPRRILALTFTNKAAREMRERIALLVGPELASQLWMGTFHSLFLRILRYNADRIGFRPNFTIYDTADTKSLLKAIIKEKELDEKQYAVAAVSSFISQLKNALVTPASYRQNKAYMDRDRHVRRPAFADIYETYFNRCAISGAMDFDDILLYTNILFRDNEDVLEKYQDYFQYVLVDEYQDTNFAQHLVISKLSQKSQRLCVVGDDAQSIYSFRGANIQNILNLKDSYPDLVTFKLEQNYRSTQNILNAANSLIEKNKKQIPKRIFSTNSAGAKIPVIEAYTDFEESFIVANKISEIKMLQSGAYSDFAILYRTNAQSRLLEESLRKRNIPYRIYGGLSFYQRKEIKDALGYFRMTINPDDDEALRRIINYPARGIGDKTVQKVRQAAVDGGVSMWRVLCEPDIYGLSVNAGTRAKLNGFKSLIDGYIEMSESGADAFALTSHIYQTSKLVSSLYSDNTPENISRQENLNELLNAAKQFVDDRMEQGSREVSMADFLSEVSLATDQDSEEDDGMPKVTLMTVHASKGLEFRNVIIVGVEAELFPSVHSSGSMSEIEEERRLLYVAITRAKENCVMTYARSRFQNGASRPCSPSRFIKDIDRSLLIMSGSTGGQNYVKDRFEEFVERKQRPILEERPIAAPRRLTPLSTSPSRTAQAAPADRPSSASAPVNSDYEVGMRIRHDRFGVGEITKVESNPDVKVTVNFENVGIKVLLVKFAKFTIIQ